MDESHVRVTSVIQSRLSGVPVQRLQRRDLDRTVYGIRAPAGTSDRLIGRCRMFAARFPETHFFSHTTAAMIMRAPLPWRLETLDVLHLSVEQPTRAPHARGLRGHSRQVSPGDVTMTSGVRHSSPERAWCELASMLDISDLVAVGDHLIHHRAQHTTRERLHERIMVGDRITRSRKLLPALQLLDDRAESRRESILRVLLIWSGLSDALVNRKIVASSNGPGIRTDFTFAAERVVVEYQGDYHRTRAQWRKDMTRRSRLESHGWYVLEVNADDLKDSAELTARLKRVLARQLRLFALDRQQ